MRPADGALAPRKPHGRDTMSLNVQEAAHVLGVSAETIRRWARQGILSTRRPAGEPSFDPDDLAAWARRQGLTVQAPPPRPAAPQAPAVGRVAAALERGGIVRELAASDRASALEALVGAAPLPEGCDRAVLLEHLQTREGLSTTGLGDGIALPHPRKPTAAFCKEPLVVIGLLQEPVDWEAIDGKPVHALILLLSPSPAEHLQTLSRVAFLLRDASFCELLARRAEDEEIRRGVAEREPAGP